MRRSSSSTLTFLGANLLKLLEGGWVPLLFGGVMVLLIVTWRRGSRHPVEQDAPRSKSRSTRCAQPGEEAAARRARHGGVPHQRSGFSAPTALLHSLKHYKVLHEHNVILTVETTDTPRVGDDERVEIEPISDDFPRVALRFGFMETPNVPKALAARAQARPALRHHVDVVLSCRAALRPAPRSGMPPWQDRLFIALARSANDATDYFQIPTDRVVEVGTQVTI